MSESDTCEIEGCENPGAYVRQYTIDKEAPGSHIQDVLGALEDQDPTFTVTLCKMHSFLFENYPAMVKKAPLQLVRPS